MQVKEYEKAEEMYRRGLEYAGGQDIAAARLAQLLIERKRPGESTEMIKRLVDIQRGKGGEAASMPALGDFDAMRRKMEETPIPQRARAWYNVALGQLRQKQFAQALKSAEWAVKFAPDDARCLHVHGVALMENQRYDEAIPQLYSALQHDPSSSEAAEALVVALTQTANYAEAVRVAGETLDRDATNQALSLRLAWLLAAAPDDAVRDGARALQIVRPLAAASSTDPAADDVLGAALAETGAFNEAIAAAGRALDKVRKRGEEQVAADISQRLEEYRQSRPHRLRLSNAATSLPAVGPPAP
jgi:tetratricopeptide (TPR) repeat protein